MKIILLYIKDVMSNVMPGLSHGGLMATTVVSGSIGLGTSPGRGHCFVSLGNTLYPHSPSLDPGV